MKWFVMLLSSLLLLRLGLFYLFPMAVPTGQKVSFSAVIFSDPTVSGSRQSFTIRYGNFWQSVPVYVSTSLNTDISYGQTLQVIGTLDKKMLKSKKTILAIQNAQVEAKSSGFLPFLVSLGSK